MATRLFVRQLYSFLALGLLTTGGFGVAPFAHAQQDGSGASSRDPSAAAGDLDPAFGNGGLVTTDFFGNLDNAFSAAIQSDGKIVVAGAAQASDASASSNFALARYNPDGSLDPGFGAGGKQTTDFFGKQDQANSVAIQSDGKIVAAGFARHSDSFSTTDFAIARYNSDGSLDQSFGSGGKLTTDFFGSADLATRLAIQPDGKLVAAGVAQHSNDATTADFAVARYNPDGSLDQSFGVGGKQTTDFFGDQDYAAAVAVQPDGRIVAVGVAKHPQSSKADFALARYNPDGSLDQTFGTAGRQTNSLLGFYDLAASVAIQPDGKIVAAGQAYRAPPGGASNPDFAVARYNPDGSLDQSFGSGGIKTTDFFGSYAAAGAVVVQLDGKIVVAGSAWHNANIATSDFALARYSVPPDFAISFGQPSVTAQAGTKVAVTTLITRIGGFNGNITVTPPQPSMGIKPKPPAPFTTGGDTAVFKMKVGALVSPGSYNLAFTATDDTGSRTHTATLTIIVQ